MEILLLYSQLLLEANYSYRELNFNISKGDKYIEYKVKENNKLKEYRDLARYYGFRVEAIKLKNGHLLKIYGDTQEELSNFLNLHLKTMI